MTPERKAELRAHADGLRAIVDELLDDNAKLEFEVLESRGNFEAAQARIAELERDRDAAWNPDPDKCPVHEGSVHGGEAEELRAGIEKIIGDLDLDIDHEAKVQLQRLLDSVDARDSLGHLERGDIVTDLRKQVSDRDRSIEELTSRTSELLGMVASLQAQHDADAARIAGLEAAANRRLVERDARIDEVAAEREAERAKRERIEAAARRMVEVGDCGLPIAAAIDAVSALRIALGGGS